jgi:hypothetical protein
MPSELSGIYIIELLVIGSKKLGQPQPLSNLAVLLNKGLPQAAQWKVPTSLLVSKALLKGLSVPFCLAI